MASGVMAEAGVMVPTSGSELTGWSKVSVVLQWRMSMHERLCTTTLLAPFQARTHDARLGSSVRALYGVAWVHKPPCGIVAVQRGGRRAPTRREMFRFERFDFCPRHFGHLDLRLESAGGPINHHPGWFFCHGMLM